MLPNQPGPRDRPRRSAERPRRPGIAAGAMLALALAVALLASAPAPRAAAQDAPADPYVPGKVVVRYHDATGPLAQVGAELGGYQVLDVPPGLTEDEFITRLSADPAVATAERDIRVRAAGIPSDPHYPFSQASYMAPMGAESAWNLETGSRSVVVAVIDTGIDLTHPDFAGQLWVNEDEIPGNGQDDDLNGCVDDINGCRIISPTPENFASCGYTDKARTGDIRDDSPNSHGTMAAGIAGARGNNGIGIAGAAWNVRLMPIKVLDCKANGSMSNVAEAILYAAANGADIINLSLVSNSVTENQMLRDAVIAAGARGAIIVAATGNHEPDDPDPGVGYPAAYAGQPGFGHVVAVGAATDDYQRAPFSNAGPAVTVAAPGVNIAGPIRTDLAGDAEPYGANDGTSMAAPIVSGLFALIEARNPALAPQEAVGLVRQTATPVANNSGNWAGAGVVHFGRAIERLPMSLSGDAFHDWQVVPDGTPITAYIGETICGSSTVTSNGVTATYTLRVAADAERPGCGATGRFVRILLGDDATVAPIAWSAPDTSLALDQDLEARTPNPGRTFTLDLARGWNNIGQVPVGGLPRFALSYLADAWTIAYAWRPNLPDGYGDRGSYVRLPRTGFDWAATWDLVRQYDAYWLFVPEATAIDVSRGEVAPRSVRLEPGWNNIYYTGPTARLRDIFAPVDGSYTMVLRWDSAAGRYWSFWPGRQPYENDFEALYPFTSYWVYMETGGTITFAGLPLPADE